MQSSSKFKDDIIRSERQRCLQMKMWGQTLDLNQNLEQDQDLV